MSTKIVVGMSGASGALLGIRALELLRECGWETHLVVSRAAIRTIAEKTCRTVREVRQLANVSYNVSDVGAAIASGSFVTAGMLIAPCSVKSAAEIAYGTTSNLLTRAADVVLKERRRLVVLFRESPLHIGHLRMLTLLSEAGAIVAPPVPAFYMQPDTIEAAVDQIVGRALDLFGIRTPSMRRWDGQGYKK